MCLVRVSGEDLGSEVCVGAVVNYEANDSHETAGRCEKMEYEGVTVRGSGAQLGKGVACQGEVRAHEGLWRELLEERLQALDCAIAGEGASVQIDALVANTGERSLQSSGSSLKAAHQALTKCCMMGRV